MKNTGNKSEAEILRQKAEELLKEKSEAKILELIEELAFQNEEKTKRADELIIANKELAFQNEEKAKRADELLIANKELAFQNEELQHARAMAEAANDKYIRLYDLAPSGYFTLSSKGEIIELNISGAKMLGKDRQHLKNSLFGFFVSEETKPIFRLFLEKAFKSKSKVECDVTLLNDGNLPLYGHLTGIVYENGEQCLVNMIDITGRKLADEAVKESEEKYRNVFASERDSLFLIDRGTQAILDVNDAACVLYGYSREEMLKLKNSDMSSEPQETKLATTEFKDRIDLRYHKKKDGTIFPVEISASLFILKDKEVILASIRDITTRIQTELLLRQNEAHLKEAQAVAKVGSWETDLSTSKVIWSDETYRIFGIDDDSFRNSHQGFLEFVHPDDRAKVDEAFAGSIGTKSVHAIEHRIITPKGLVKFIEERWHILYNDQGQPAQAEGTCQDITERKQAEETLQNKQILLRTIIDNIPYQIYYKDEQGRFLLCNPAVAHNCGANTTDEMIGKTDFNFFQQHLAKQYFDDEQSIMKSGISLINHEEICTNNMSDDVRWNLTTKIPLIDTNGNMKGLIGINRDITDRKKAEAQIKLKNEELSKINSEKDRFFSIIAHDLRGPFNGFLGLSKLLAEDLPHLTQEEIKKMAGSMRDSATNLFRLLENLLEWSRLQRGITSFEPGQFLLMPMIAETMRPVMGEANKKEIEIRYKIPSDLEVFADEYMLASTIRNLASNAVKFTTKGGKVTISAKTTPGNSVEFSVRDTGIGMSPQMVDDLFRLDVQTNRRGTEDEPSSGLGLLLCKDFIEKHGGKIWVESEEGKGSTFYFTLPAAPPRNR